MEKKYRLWGKKLFITYSSEAIREYRLEEIKEEIEEKFMKNRLLDYLIVKEEGEEKKKEHVHCYLRFEKPVDVKRADRLDLIKKERVHGKYEKSKGEVSSIEYILKQVKLKDKENYIANEEIKDRITEWGGYMSKEEVYMKYIIEGNFDKARDWLMRNKAYAYSKNPEQFERGMRYIYAREKGIILNYKVQEYKLKTDFIKVLSNYVVRKDGQWWDGSFEDLSLLKWKSGKSLYIYGPTNTGKTSFIISLITELTGKKPLIVNELPDGLRFKKGEGVIVIDDAHGIEELTRERLINLLDYERDSQVNIKHGTVTIPAGTQRIFLDNNKPTVKNKCFSSEAVSRRIEVVKLDESLIDSSIVS